jgi:methionyl aminopeptidase
MINMGRRQVRTLADQWTVVTADGLPSAHFEHDVAIVDGKPEILSTFAYIEEALGIKSEHHGKSV